MARLILTNNLKKHQQAVARNVNAGFDDFISNQQSGIYTTVHKKKIKKLNNFVEFPNGDFCAMVGTCVYDERLGVSALEKIYSEFDGDIQVIQRNALGNYIIAIKKNDRIAIFVDKYQILKLYYFNKDGDWFIANSLADIGEVLDSLELDEFAFIQETMLVGAIDTQSLFKGVFRLFGHEFIEIDCQSKSFKINSLSFSREHRNFNERSIESVVLEYADIVRSKFRTVAHFFGGNVRIHQTGGLDNRTVFAAFMSVGCKPKIMYGVGNSVLSNTQKEDLMICKEYKGKFDLDLYEMNWREEYLGADQYWAELFSRYGFNYSIYAGSRNFFKEYEGLIPNYPSFMECGYFLENLRLRDFAIESKKNRFSIDEFINDYLLGGGYGDLTGSPQFYKNIMGIKEALHSTLKKYMRLYGIEADPFFSLDDFDQVRWIHSRNCDSVTVNYLNDFAPSIAMFSLPELHEFPFDVPAKWRANARFQLMLIDALCPEALSIPIFSHCCKQRFNRKQFTLSPEYPFSQRVAKGLRSLGFSSTAYNMIRSLYRHCLATKSKTAVRNETQALMQYVLPIINQNLRCFGDLISAENYKGSIIYLMIFAQYLYGVNLLNEHKGS